jgi:drug/metabolite transporter, DME family
MLPSRGTNSAILGTACCVASALGYTTVNVLKRSLAVEYDRPMVLAVLDSVSVVLVGAWLLWHARSRLAPAARRSLPAIVGVGLASQFLGNLPVLWAMSVVGLAVSITAVYGMSLLGGAVFGKIFLGERVTLRSAAAVTVLFAAIVLISFGADPTNAALAVRTEPGRGTLGVSAAIGAACLTGLVYGGLNGVVRRILVGGTPHALVLFIVPATGVATLGPLSLYRQGLTGVLSTPAQDMGIILLAGFINLLAYLALLQGLRWMSLLRNNFLLASQVAMTAVAGIVLFGESPTMGLVCGVVLTIAGIFLLDQPAAAEQNTTDRRPAV